MAFESSGSPTISSGWCGLGGHFLIVSPHVDDAAFSVAGAARTHVLRGDSVSIVTVFSKSEYLENYLPSTSKSVSEVRRQEDWLFLEKLNDGALSESRASMDWLDFPDAPLRPKYSNGELCISRPLDSEDLAIVAELSVKLLNFVQRQTHLVLPLGLGRHVDHVIAREAGLSLAPLCATTFFYEDLPYAGERPEAFARAYVDSFAAFRGFNIERDIVPIPSGVTWKIGIVKSYASQCTRQCLQCISNHAKRLSIQGSERLWQLVAYADSERCMEIIDTQLYNS